MTGDDDDFLDGFYMKQIVLDINKITENLWQGAIPPKGEILAKKGFQVVVLCADENQDAAGYPGLEVICAPGDDDERVHRMERDLKVWIPASQQVVEAVRQGKKVLVTCMAGLNRSGMVTALALRELTGWSGPAIVKHVKARRPYALCNSTFEKYIKESFPEAKKSQ